VTASTPARTTAADWVREPAVAGLFYPDDAADLRAAVTGHVDRAPAPEGPAEAGALIAPHAGYRYSGATAGVAYRMVAERQGLIQRVVLAGPAHRVPVEGVGVGVTSARAWRTPLGEVPVDVEACGRLVSAGAAVAADEAHAPEHSLEVHLPFIQQVLGPVPIVPLLVGRCLASVVAAALELAWDDHATLVVISSDLSHYLDEDEARARDDRTRQAIIEGRAGDIGPYDACGSVAVTGLMVAAQHRDVVPRTLALSTSADASGDRTRVVGYGSFAFEPPRPLLPVEGDWLVARARAAIAHELRTGTVDPLDDEDVPERLCLPGASFVTLDYAGDMAGCIGSLEPSRPLWRDVALNARGAAFADPRFDALAAADLDHTDITVSVLSTMERLPSEPEALAAALRPGADGLMVEAEGSRGTFLPSVWHKLPTPASFVRSLMAKADLPPEPWPDDVRAWRYTTDEFTG
jgi:hypothetical protein